MSNNPIAIYNLICRESLTSTVKMICENISIDNIYKEWTEYLQQPILYSWAAEIFHLVTNIMLKRPSLLSL